MAVMAGCRKLVGQPTCLLLLLPLTHRNAANTKTKQRPHQTQIYIGSNMLVCVADPVVAKRMLGKLSFRHAGIQLLAGPQDWDFLLDGLVGAK